MNPNIEEMKKKGHIDDLTQLFFSQDMQLAHSAIEALSPPALLELGKNRSIMPDRLFKTLKHSDPYMRRRSAEIIGQVCDSAFVKARINALSEGSEKMRQRLSALGLDNEDLIRNIHKDIECLRQELQSSPAYQPLQEVLNDSDQEVKQAVSNALSKINPPAEINP